MNENHDSLPQKTEIMEQNQDFNATTLDSNLDKENEPGKPNVEYDNISIEVIPLDDKIETNYLEQMFGQKYECDVDELIEFYIKNKIKSIDPNKMITHIIRLNKDLKNILIDMKMHASETEGFLKLFPHFCGFALSIKEEKFIVFGEIDPNCTEKNFNSFYDNLDSKLKIQHCFYLVSLFIYIYKHNASAIFTEEDIDFNFNPNNSELNTPGLLKYLDLEYKNEKENVFNDFIRMNEEIIFHSMRKLLGDEITINIPQEILKLARFYYNQDIKCENIISNYKYILNDDQIQEWKNKINKSELLKTAAHDKYLTKYYQYINDYYIVVQAEKNKIIDAVKIIEKNRLLFSEMEFFWEEEELAYFIIFDKSKEMDELNIEMNNNGIPMYSLMESIRKEYENQELAYYSLEAKLSIIRHLIGYYMHNQRHYENIKEFNLSSIYFDDDYRISIVPGVENNHNDETNDIFKLSFYQNPEYNGKSLFKYKIIRIIQAILSINSELIKDDCDIDEIMDSPNPSNLLREQTNKIRDYCNFLKSDLTDNQEDKAKQLIDGEDLLKENAYLSLFYGIDCWTIPDNDYFKVILIKYGWKKYSEVPDGHYYTYGIDISKMKPIDLLRRLKLEFTLENKYIAKLIGCEYNEDEHKIIFHRDCEKFIKMHPYSIKYSHSLLKKTWIDQLIEIVQYMNQNYLLLACKTFLFEDGKFIRIPGALDINYDLEFNYEQVCDHNSKWLQNLLKIWFEDFNCINFPIAIKELIFQKENWNYHSFLELSNIIRIFPYLKYQIKEKLKGFKVYKTYKGHHCDIQFFQKDDKKYVLKKYEGHLYDVISIISVGDKFTSHVIGSYFEKNFTYFLVDYIDEPFEKIDPKKKIPSKFVVNIVNSLLEIQEFHYLRWNPKNILINYQTGEMKLVDFIPLTCNNLNEYFDDYCSPDCLIMKNYDRNCLIFIDLVSLAILINEAGLDPKLISNFARIHEKYYNSFPSYFFKILEKSKREKYISLINKYLTDMEVEIKEPIFKSSSLKICESNIKGSTKALLTARKFIYENISHEIYKIIKNFENLNSKDYNLKTIGFSAEECHYLTIYIDYNDIEPIKKMNEDKYLFLLWSRLANDIHSKDNLLPQIRYELVFTQKKHDIKILNLKYLYDEDSMLSFERLKGPKPLKSDLTSNKKADIYILGKILKHYNKMINCHKKQMNSLIRRCLARNAISRPTAREINKTIIEIFKAIDDEYQLEDLNKYEEIDLNSEFGQIIEKETKKSYLYRIFDVKNPENLNKNLQGLMNIQNMNVLQIEYFYIFKNRNLNKCLLIIEDRKMIPLNEYLKSNVLSKNDITTLINDILAAFESYHQYKYKFGPFSLNRFFIDDQGSIVLDAFMVDNLKYEFEIDPDFETPEKVVSLESDVYQFGILALKLFNVFDMLKGLDIAKNIRKTNIPQAYQMNIKKCFDIRPEKRISFSELFKKLNSGVAKGVSSFLSLSTSRYSGFSINKIKDDEYDVISELGSGQFGRVCKVVMKASKEELAMKEFFAKKDSSNNDFYVEYAALKSLNHPHIVKVAGAMQSGADNNPRIFMEYASGGTFNNKMNEPFEDFCVHLVQISSAMNYLHDRDIIHHDLKPDNILIRNDNTAVVTDFNVAVHLTNFESKLCKTKGTINYMSPEILKSEPYSFSTDVFSFGLIIVDYYSMENHSKVFEDILNFRKPDLSFIEDENMRKLVKLCLKRNPTKRPPFRAITQYIVEAFLDKDPKYSCLIKQKRIDDAKLKQLETLSNVGDLDAINEYGKHLILEGNIEKAEKIFKIGAKLKCPRAINTCGTIKLVGMFDYFVQKIRERNKNYKGYDNTMDIYEDCLNLFQEAAQLNDKHGLVNYGYFKYEKMLDDPEMAAKYYRKAIELDNPFAKFLLGRIYLRNRFLMNWKESKNEAIRLFEEGAQERDSYCQFRYAMLIKEGVVPEDQAFLPWRELVRLSAYQKNKFAEYEYAKLLKGTEFVKDYRYISSDIICGFNPDWEYYQYFSDKVCELQNCLKLIDDSEINKHYTRINESGLGNRNM